MDAQGRAASLADSLPEGSTDLEHFESECEETGALREQVFIAYKVELLFRRDMLQTTRANSPDGADSNQGQNRI